MAMRHRGVSLVELVLVVLLVGILTAVAVPRLNLAAIDGQRSAGLARRLSADLRYTRQLALSGAAENPAGFGLFLTGPEPGGGYEIRDLSDGRVLRRYAIDASAKCEGGSAFRFGPLGNLLAGSDTQLTVTAGRRRYMISLVPATGVVQCTQE